MGSKQTNMLFLAQNLQSSRSKIGSNDRFGEDLTDLVSGGLIKWTITANNAAKGRDGIARICLFVGTNQRIVTGQASRVGMLDNRHSGGRKALYSP